MKNKRRESPVELWEDLSRELWEVKHGAAAPRLMTLDELDAAFKNEEIDAHTLLRKAGTTQWRTLGDIAGLPPPSTITLESESLMPVTSEIEVPAAKRPSKPPPLPRKSKDEIKADAPKPVPRRSDDDIRFSESDAFRLRKSRSTMDVMSDEIELRSSDIDVVKLDLGKKKELGNKKETSTVEPPAARLREDAPFTREMRAARPRSMTGKLVAVVAVALVGGGVFAGVSAWLTGTFGTSSTHALRAPAVEAPAQPANEEAPPSTATITSSESSMLVLAQGQRTSAPENESAKADAAKADEAKPEAKAAAAPAKPAAAPNKSGKAPTAHAPSKPKPAQAGPRVASTPRPAPAKAYAQAALPTFKVDKKGGDAKVPASKKAKAK
jgi:hypothetical protein